MPSLGTILYVRCRSVPMHRERSSTQPPIHTRCRICIEILDRVVIQRYVETVECELSQRDATQSARIPCSVLRQRQVRSHAGKKKKDSHLDLFERGRDIELGLDAPSSASQPHSSQKRRNFFFNSQSASICCFLFCRLSLAFHT